MRYMSWRGFAACLSLLVSGTSVAGLVTVSGGSSGYFPQEARTVEGGRDVQVVVAQAEIKPNINISNMTAAAGGGLLFAMIDAGVNNSRAKEAEKVVVPMREALVGYDFDPRVQLASSNLLAGLGWFDPRTQKFSKDESPAAILSAVDAAGTSQLMVMNYSYETSADFSAVVVTLKATLVNKALPKGKKSEARLQPKFLPWSQSVRSFVLLPGANPKDAAANAQGWAAEGGAKARTAIEVGIDRCVQLMQRSLALSAADATAMKKRNKRKMSAVPGVMGWEIDAQPTHTVYYEGGQLTQVEDFGVAPVSATAAPAAPAAEAAPAAPAPAAEAAPAPAATPAQ